MSTYQDSSTPTELSSSSSCSTEGSVKCDAEYLIDTYQVKTQVTVRFDSHDATEAVVTVENTARKAVTSMTDEAELEAHADKLKEWVEIQVKTIDLSSEGLDREEVEYKVYLAVTTDNEKTPDKAKDWIGNMAGMDLDVTVEGSIFEPNPK